MSTASLRVALWQCHSHPLDVAGNLARLGAVCEAAADRVDVLVTPEMFVSGYAITPADTRRLAQAADGPVAQELAVLSSRTGVAIAYGFVELAPDDSLYNAAALVDDGRVLAVHRKAHLFGSLDRSRFAPAPQLPPVVALRGRQVGLLICYDVEFPESVRSVATRGASVVLVPTANMAGYELVPTVLVRARAYENGCFVAYANYCGREAGLEYAGLSTVCGPSGEVLALAGSGEELVIADLPAVPASSGRGYLADRRTDLFGP